jgi:hypothetical protein
MRYVAILFLVICTGCGVRVSVTAQQRYDKAIGKLTQAVTKEQRFYALDDAAKESVVSGRIDDARKYAYELIALAPEFKDNWNYGNAIQDGNLVLGRIAVQEGRIDEAKQRLLDAGKSPGSPVMDSFGPNMSLANDLLQNGQQEVVLRYLEQCHTFWKNHDETLDMWREDIQAGRIPKFGANLSY